MALNDNFYTDIFEKEKYCIELINKGLLNIYYLQGNNGLKKYYIEKKKELNKQYDSNPNEILKKILDIITQIINKINNMEIEFRAGKEINFNNLSDLFLYTQMNSTNNINKKEEILNLQIRKQVLQSLQDKYRNDEKLFDDSYIYDDFPNNQKTA